MQCEYLLVLQDYCTRRFGKRLRTNETVRFRHSDDAKFAFFNPIFQVRLKLRNEFHCATEPFAVPTDRVFEWSSRKEYSRFNS